MENNKKTAGSLRRTWLWGMALAVGALVILGIAFFVRAGIRKSEYAPKERRVIELMKKDAESGEEFTKTLHALSAVLMDAESGRVLFAKEQDAVRAMASTTKVMTCMVALEHASLDAVYETSAYAASMPKVHMGARQGEKYRLKDLLYALMLESYNDAAVIIAEGVAGSVEGFAQLMNQKAEELGLSQTSFVTPNGLDANGHETTAKELALVMRYAIQNETFQTITQASSYSFCDVSGKRRYVVTNHNRLLQLMNGVISGKTGFTGKAGYCYVGAVKNQGHTFIVSLLGSGWPPHQTYKWSDAMALLNFGFQNYQEQKILDQYQYTCEIPVYNGVEKTVSARVDADFSMLLSKGDSLSVRLEAEQELPAPVMEDMVVGRLMIYVNEVCVQTEELRTQKRVEEYSYLLCFRKVCRIFFGIFSQ